MAQFRTSIACCALAAALLWGCAPPLRLNAAPPPWEAGGYRGGNAVRLLADGPEAYEVIFGAVAAARHHIHLQTYMLCSDAVGRRLAETLASRRRAGVEVRVLVDDFGSRCAEPRFIEEMRSQGIEVAVHHPAGDSGLLDLGRANQRDHRKLLVIDGEVAFIGGTNLTSAYRASAFPLGRRNRPRGWRDTDLKVEGPAVAAFQEVFLSAWRRLAPGPAAPDRLYFPPLPSRGEARVGVLASRGGDGGNPIYETYLAAVEEARTRVWITQGYFAPERRLVAALADAARRGVDVRLLLPSFSDVPPVRHRGRAHYGELLRAGVRIYERHDAMLHAKTAVVDGLWATVGSFNLDHRSLLHNHEANGALLDSALAAQLEELFLADLRHSRAITLAEWERRPVGERLMERLSWLVEYWL